ncbi:hypothetical protein [Candidatus Nitrosocosmicus franklandus]|uniref:Uncharacterized protein n=1 Tax=Candidatus Nitrosocosmicus franklandianus TaxID=1798806 RepID=A0A484IDR9_9ARCH|nr:hypothetical protein [Candidatus Nitrosocosmicus franklandus]VFJ13124.1 conserved protein of unknown function [Candidatus Nitrosocosmicus franklandus]
MELENNNVSTESEEEYFRKSYALELQKKRQQINDYQRGFNELEEERRQVNQQAIRTPGRRGEIIKKEEIEKEFARRYKENYNKRT